MRKFKSLLLAGLLVLAFSVLPKGDAKSQIALSKTTSNPTGAISNSGADTSSFTQSVSKLWKLVEVTVSIVRNSGTLAGTATLYGSHDGTYWSATGETLSISNGATYTGTMYVQNKAFKYWRVVVNGMTTVSCNVSGKIAFFEFQGY